MQIGVMKTNFGPHPASKWADTTADQIVTVDPSASEDQLQAGNVLRDKLVDVLEKHHALVQKHERDELADDDERVATELKPEDYHVAEAVAAVIAVAAGTAFAAHFAKPEIVDYLHRLLTQHFQTSMDVERSWHADRNPDADVAQAYRKARTEHGSHLAHHFIHHYRSKAA